MDFCVFNIYIRVVAVRGHHHFQSQRAESLYYAGLVQLIYRCLKNVAISLQLGLC